ncbi:hypothetical protein CMUS01_15069 [Colletotrichum musicola]|uniref:Uncharacterized protein n=1 Tax=Colletotrichum musicola TaxID=2175873 RepID=A0A8H6IZ17_9PEZI|nr:hypothetical protein CMUS01_15069 [Colletotrichum musicola]
MVKISITLILAAASMALAAPGSIDERQAAGCAPEDTVCRNGDAWCCIGSSCWQFAPPVAC